MSRKTANVFYSPVHRFMMRINIVFLSRARTGLINNKILSEDERKWQMTILFILFSISNKNVKINHLTNEIISSINVVVGRSMLNDRNNRYDSIE